MLLYFFAAHKPNYARYGLFFSRSLTLLPPEVKQQFLRGEQVLHHVDGLWNGIPSDQFIETTWMKRGKGPSGIVGVTQNPQTVATWSYSQHAVITLTGDLQTMTEEDRTPKLVHKEESNGRIKTDAQDRQSICSTLLDCVDPMDPDSHPDGALMNIVTGAIAQQDVNIDRALILGQEQVEASESSWPEGFYNLLKNRVVTFSGNRKAVKVIAVIDQEAIYAIVIGLMASQRDVDLEQQWAKKTSKCAGAPKLCSLPPTTEAFVENMKRAHFQVAQWYAALESDPPLGPLDYGWEADDVNRSLSAIPVPAGVSPAPEYVLRLIRCGCESDTACKTGNCRCMGRQLPCTIFCAYTGGLSCCNKFTSKPPSDDDDEVDDVVQETG
ncbi:hypothetical protein ACOMHN_052224 [Nucella lapillus]